MQTNPRNRFGQPALTAFNTSLNVPGRESIERAKIFRNQSFHGFGTGLGNNQIGLRQNIGGRNILQAPVKKISQQNLQNINFISPLYHPPYDFLGSNGVIHTIKSSSVKTIDRVAGRNESKLDIRRTASGINTYSEDKKSDTKPIQIDKTNNKQSIGKRSYSSLTLRKHRCYSPTFYSVRCKKHAKRRPIIYAILKNSKTSQHKPTNSQQQNNDQMQYENLTDSIQICEQNANGDQKKIPKPAPRCKKHKRQDIVYENVSKILNTSNESSLNDAEVKVSTIEAVVHKNSIGKAENDVSQPTNLSSQIGVEIVSSPKSPISNLKLTPTLKVSPNFVKPPIESPKGALNMQLQARLKNSTNQTLATVSTQTAFKETEKEIRKTEFKDSKSSIVPSPKIIRDSNAANAKPLIVKPQRTVPPKVLGANAKKGVLLASASNQVCFSFFFLFCFV